MSKVKVTGQIAIIIPTLGRCDELRRMLRSLARQTHVSDQVVIVDEAGEGNDLAREFPALSISVTTFPRGSASAKRNRGVQHVSSGIDLIGFMDDDIVLDPGAIEAMLDFWKHAPSEVAGASCNWMNPPPRDASRLKSLRLVSRLGLYDSRGGLVMRSGFQTVIGIVSETRYVQWLPSGAAVYPRRILEEYCFDEWFRGYSYLEDLDFSYTLGKMYKLAVVANAQFHHYPSEIGRLDPYVFGKREVVNRFHFVRKHTELSPALCAFVLANRTLMSVILGVTTLRGAHLRRAWGNLVAVCSGLTHGSGSVA
ncbi:MAG: glycosyltransferase family 2 protein [Terriglobia bacterium]